MPQCNIESMSEMPHLGLLPLASQIRLYSSFQKEHKWNRSSWLEKGSRSSENWSCYLCEGCCKWSWLLLERVLREDMIREPKILLQLRTDSCNLGKIFWSHCWLFSKLTTCATAASKVNEAVDIIRKSIGNAHFMVVLEKVQRRKTAAVKGM